MRIQYSAGLFINENPFITSSTLVFESGAECINEARKRCRVLRDLDKKAHCILNSTTRELPDSVGEISEDYEKKPSKKQKNTNVTDPTPPQQSPQPP